MSQQNIPNKRRRWKFGAPNDVQKVKARREKNIPIKRSRWKFGVPNDVQKVEVRRREQNFETDR
jgi:hypothetical protein